MELQIAIDARRIRDFGIGTYIRSLVQALSSIDTVNRYTLVTEPGDARALAGLPDNFRSVVYTHNDAAHSDNVLFPLFLRSHRLDLVHVPLNRVPVFMFRPYVVTVHDMSNLIFGEERTRLRMGLRRWRLLRGLRRASRIIAVSDATRREVETLLGVSSGRIRRVYNAPDPGFMMNHSSEGQKQRILERYQIRHPFLLYAGNIRRQKNVPRLVEAFAVLREQLSNHPIYRDLHLVIIGDTISQNPAVRQAVFRTRTEHLVRFLGFVPSETLKCFYESAAAFVFPSRYEGFGLPPLEAMGCGTPVVTSNTSSLPEVVGDAAVLVNPENVFDIARGIHEVLLDENLRCELIRRGYEQAARFSWTTTARQVLEIYQDAATLRCREP